MRLRIGSFARSSCVTPEAYTGASVPSSSPQAWSGCACDRKIASGRIFDSSPLRFCPKSHRRRNALFQQNRGVPRVPARGLLDVALGAEELQVHGRTTDLRRPTRRRERRPTGAPAACPSRKAGDRRARERPVRRPRCETRTSASRRRRAWAWQPDRTSDRPGAAAPRAHSAAPTTCSRSSGSPAA